VQPEQLDAVHPAQAEPTLVLSPSPEPARPKKPDITRFVFFAPQSSHLGALSAFERLTSTSKRPLQEPHSYS
jgi:hypothetical protein